MPKPYASSFSPILYGGMYLRALTIALVSYLEALSAKGKWLIYAPCSDIESKKQFAQWLCVLEAYGFEWDDNEIAEPLLGAMDYDSVINKLLAQGLAYACHCSDDQLQNPIYSGICRDALKPIDDAAIRLRTPDLAYQFTDHLQGLYRQNIGQQVGDFIIRDRLGIINADFAMVLDDAKREVTQVVRGVEFLSDTPKQLYLQELLGLTSPHYLHVPKMYNEQSHLNTLTSLLNLSDKQKTLLLIDLLSQLNQLLGSDLKTLTPKQLLVSVADYWCVDRLAKDH